MATFLQNLKKIAVLAIATIAVSLSANAQEWYIYGEYTWSAPHPVGDFYEYYNVGDIVTIQGIEYQEIIANRIDKGIYLDGAFRNEDNQVYFCKWNGTSYDDEIMLYDYDLEEGDFFHDDDEHPMQVVEISTIIDENGVSRRKFTFQFLGLEDVTEFWIEGVGSNRGFTHVGMYEALHDSDGEMYHLLCYHVDDNVVYVNPEYNECDLPYSVEENAESIVNIFPNPARDVVKILNSNDLNITNIEIIDLMGRIVITSSKTDDIDVSELPEGQYFVKIYGNQTIVRKLFIKK